MSSTFILEKMRHESVSAQGKPLELRYFLGEKCVNEHVGQEFKIQFTGKKYCIHCGRESKKLFGEGACFPCFQKKAACDLCIVKPELCHYHLGTCREPDWGKSHCLIPHLVYLCNTTGLKVGITRLHKKFERWGDQGAVAAIELAIVPERRVAGLLEIVLAEHVRDKADWRALLRGDVFEIPLVDERRRISELVPSEYQQYLVPEAEFPSAHEFRYPISSYLKKVVSHNFDKEPELAGELKGVRGQYLFVGEVAVNIRKFSGYEVQL